MRYYALLLGLVLVTACQTPAEPDIVSCPSRAGTWDVIGSSGGQPVSGTLVITLPQSGNNDIIEGRWTLSFGIGRTMQGRILPTFLINNGQTNPGEPMRLQVDGSAWPLEVRSWLGCSMSGSLRAWDPISGEFLYSGTIDAFLQPSP